MAYKLSVIFLSNLLIALYRMKTFLFKRKTVGFALSNQLKQTIRWEILALKRPAKVGNNI